MTKKPGYYANRIKVVGADMQCFPVDPKTLEPLSCGCYDPYAWSDPDPEPIETIGVHEWEARRNEQWYRNRDKGNQNVHA